MWISDQIDPVDHPKGNGTPITDRIDPLRMTALILTLLIEGVLHPHLEGSRHLLVLEISLVSSAIIAGFMDTMLGNVTKLLLKHLYLNLPLQKTIRGQAPRPALRPGSGWLGIFFFWLFRSRLILKG